MCVFVVLGVVLCLRDPGDCPVVARRFFGTASDGFQAQKRGSWIPGKERAERVLANAIYVQILF